jgi:hypothetical protein
MNFWYILILECWQIVFKSRCDGEELLNDGCSLGEMMKGEWRQLHLGFQKSNNVAICLSKLKQIKTLTLE